MIAPERTAGKPFFGVFGRQKRRGAAFKPSANQTNSAKQVRHF
jgi:hypothetical protein